MCSKGGGSPPVPSAASTTFNSTTSPNPAVAPLYTDFLNRAGTLSNTPFNPAMLGSVAPLNAEQQAAGGQLFSLGMDMGNFDPAKVHAIESPYTEDVVNATQNWFNNQNAIQGNDLISGAIKQGNAFGGDRAGVAQGVLAGQQQLAQAPVIAGLRQAGYTQALDEYNRLKQFGIQGAGAAMGWGGLEQQQAQRELDVAQQNAMMASAYPFQTLNWYGSALGGIGPLLGQTAAGSNNPPDPNSLSQGLGVASSAIGLGSAALGATGSGGGRWRGGSIHRARGGIVDDDELDNIIYLPPRPRGLAYGGDPSTSSYDDSDEDKYRSRDQEPEPSRSDQPDYNAPAPRRVARPDFGFGKVSISPHQVPQPVFPNTSGTSTQPQKSDASSILDFGAKVIPFVAKAAPFFIQTGGGVGHFAYGGSDDTDIMSDASDDPVLPGQQYARDYAGRTTWFNPRNESGGYTYTDEGGQNWTDRGARALREGPHASGLPSSTRGFATPGSGDLGNWFEVNLPGGRKTYAQKTDIGPPGVVDLNAPLASSVYSSPNAVASGRTYVRDLGRNRPSEADGMGGTQWPDPNSGDTNVSGLPSGQQPSTPGWQVPGTRQGRAAAGPTRDPDDAGGYGRDDLRPGESRTIPALARPPQTFAQRWASNPFTQMGANLLAQRSPYFGVNLGRAMQGTMAAQDEQRKQDLLDAKPEMIHHNGRILFRIGDKITDMGLATSTDETRKAAAASRPYAVERDVPGPFGSTTKTKEYYEDDPRTGERRPFQSPVGPTPPTGQPQRVIEDQEPTLPPPQAPPQVAPRQPAPQTPATPPPQLRQTQAPAQGATGTIAGDLQRPLEDRLAAAERAESGTTAPPTTPTPAPTQQAQTPQQGQAQPPAAGGPKPYSSEEAWKNIVPAGTVTNPGASAANRNEAALQGLTPGEANIIRSIADYKSDPNKVFAGKNAAMRVPAMQAVQAYDPNYNQALYPAKAQALKEYGVNGQAQKSLQSNAMVLEHIGDAMTAVDNLGNSTWPIYNKVTGTWQQQTGNEKYQAAAAAVNTTVSAAATEAAKTFRGVGSMSQREQELWHQLILGSEGDVPGASPVTMRSALKELTGLVAGRLNSTANGYNQIMGPEYYRDGESWMTPKAKETFGRAASVVPERNTPFPPSQYGFTKQQPSGGGPQQQQQQQPQGGGGWTRDPATGNVRGPDGRLYDPSGKPLQ